LTTLQEPNMAEAFPRDDDRAYRRAALVAGADALAARFAERAPEHDRAGSFPHENIADLRAAGWPALTVPTRLGGLGAGLLDTVTALERLAAGDGSTALGIAMHLQTLGAASETEAWPEDQFAAVCRAAVADGALVNACASEPELGSPSRGGLPRTTAVRDGVGWRLTGLKNFASLSPALDYFIIPAALAGETDAIGRFLVPRGPGLTIVENWDPMGMRATGSHDVVLTDVVVPNAALLYRQSAAAPDPYRATLNTWFTLSVTAVYFGVALGACAAAVRYAHGRVPTALGRPIATLDTVQHRLGQADLTLRAARALLHGTAQAWDARPGERAALAGDVVAAKVFVTNAAIDATDQAMRVVGGAAMRRDLPLERFYRDVRAGLYHPPSDDQALALLGRLALERGQADTIAPGA
jgi:alkylation response protein AidB-like acyl-CoA dehydrogenase